MDVLTNLLRTVMFFIDNVVYGLIAVIYKLFIYLSEINLFSFDDSTPLGSLISRVYVLLGIFMLFKVSFSLIQYIIDPNLFSDKSKGFGKLVTNALVTMVLLVSVPYIFTYAMKIQTQIVQSNVIGTLILGESAGKVVNVDDKGNTTGINVDTAGEMAEDVQFLLFGAFFSVNGDVIEPCKNSPVFGTVAMATNTEKVEFKGKKRTCLEALKDEFESQDNDMAAAGVGLNDFFKTPKDDKTESRYFDHFDKLLWWKVDDQYAINYLPIISTAAGIYVVFLLISFCIDVAIRAIKLAFLQMIAPIAIVSYIDPKESISNSKLHNWAKECATTYFSLFLRIATIFLVMVLISTISSSIFAKEGDISAQINNMEAGYNMWIYVFLVIGAFMFAKKVPQMIESIFGIKSSGELSLNPFKGASGALLAGGAAFAGAGAANAIAFGAQAKQVLGAEKDDRFRTIAGVDKNQWAGMSKGQRFLSTTTGIKHGIGGFFGIAGGAAAAGARVAGMGPTKGFSDIGKNSSAAMDAAKKARLERDARQSQSIGTRVSNTVTEFAGVKNKFGGYGRLDGQLRQANEELEGVQNIQTRFRERKGDTILNIADNNSSVNATLLENLNTKQYIEQAQQAILEQYKNTGLSQEKVLQMNEDIIMEKAFENYKNGETQLGHSEKELLQSVEDFKDLSKVNAQIDSSIARENELKNEIRTIKESMGKKEDKK